jgi:hypothetical protein
VQVLLHGVYNGVRKGVPSAVHPKVRFPRDVVQVGNVENPVPHHGLAAAVVATEQEPHLGTACLDGFHRPPRQ